MSVQAARKPLTTNKGAKRRIRILSILVISLVIWAFATFWDQSVKMAEEAKKIEALHAKLEETLKVNEETKREIARLNDPEAKEEKQRSDLHYASPGETLFDLPE